MKKLFFYFLLFLMVNLSWGQDSTSQVFKIGGLELSPAGYGIMETQPHQPLDTLSSEFDNYYAQMGLWVSGVSATTDTFLINPEIINTENINTFMPLELAEDTVDFLNMGNMEFVKKSRYSDRETGWNVRQFHFSFLNHSMGLILLQLTYSGESGPLSSVYAGMHFDFDAPNEDNIPTENDDILTNTFGGYRIKDSQTNKGMAVYTISPYVIKNYWMRTQSPQSKNNFISTMQTHNNTSPIENEDYHFYLGSGPYAVNEGESIILAYLLVPSTNGFNKSNDELLKAEKNIIAYSTGKNFAKIDEKVFGEKTGSISHTFQLFQNYPNPFNPTTEICFNIPESGNVHLEIYNSLGQKIRTLVDQALESGEHQLTWDSRNTNGQLVSSGVYFYRLTHENYQEQKKMLLIR